MPPVEALGTNAPPSLPDLASLLLSGGSNSSHAVEEAPLSAAPVETKDNGELQASKGSTDGSSDSAVQSTVEHLDGEINHDDLVYGAKIGSGGYKTVYRGRYQDQDVAIGVINTDKLSEDDLEDLTNETAVLQYAFY